ncbi:PQQ-dependent sugar dehydrogenase [Marihabitans asiaticum]|uniref:Glucose/arabinose dehydrogenase n=1 Tax=Marihabitans asiaticum TaxID=415218 RepID=A0A560WHG2_9MICO|nr:PQQ-dependent sugar dehydrogenase [Marihabitans asiaticum]TWD17117.1 glucose/arabinose dehydrogenase [Marihabitans asiaticum]
MSSRPLALLAAAVVGLGGCSGGGATPGASPSSDEQAGGSSQQSGSSPDAIPTERVDDLQVEVVASGLEHPWDIGFLGDGSAVVTERAGRLRHLPSLDTGTQPVELRAGLDDVYAQGEGGLLGLAVLGQGESGWAQAQVVVCFNHAEDGEPVDIRLVQLTLDPANRRATRDRDVLTGLPTSTGRHSGCRPTLASDGTLFVGTGDTADPGVPQDLSSLGGKVLRIDPDTGDGASGNPFADSSDPDQRRVYSFGHRNVQGVAQRPGTEDDPQVWTSEHGPSVDDEVNLIEPGGNYGWDPSQGGEVSSYDESVPMTDTERFPDAVEAAWSSGDPTEAIAGAAFLEGEQWGEREGMLAVTALKGEKLMLFALEGETVTQVQVPAALEEHGRLRAARLGPDGALYVTTSNGSDDKVLRVTPG